MWKPISLAIAALAVALALAPAALAQQPCDVLGGTCMEGCEAGYDPVEATGCFDSVCCMPSPPNACAAVGGTCMEGCEAGYTQTEHSGCFDSVCCVPRPPSACAAVGGTCMEGCEAGYAQTEHGGCFDSVCCVRRELASPYPPEGYLECASDEDCTVSIFVGCCVCCNCTSPYAINAAGRQAQDRMCDAVRCASCEHVRCEPCAEPMEGGWPHNPVCRDGRCAVE